MLDLVTRLVTLHQLDRGGWPCRLDGAGRCHATRGNALGDSRRSVDELGRNVLEKAGGQVEVGASEQMSPEGVEQIEPILRSGHADVREAPLFFEFLGRV